MSAGTRHPIAASENLGDVITAQADAAFIDGATGRCVSFADMAAGSDAVAARLLRGGARRGDRIALLAGNSVDYLCAYLGIMRAGLVAVPVNHRLSRDTVGLILDDCAAGIAIADDERAGLLPPWLPRLSPEEVVRPASTAAEDVVRPAPDEVAEILYTSGSTGRPKGVPLTHHGQLWALRSFAAASGTARERTVIAAPFYHMNGLFFATLALALGWSAKILPRFEASAYLRAVADMKCTMLSGIPTMFALMARETELVAQLDLSSVRDVVIGSAPLTSALVDRVQALFPAASVRNGYGTTETGPAMFGPHPEGKPRPPLALGYPYPGVEWRLTGGASDDEGVLETRTPALLSAYLNLPSETAGRFADGWFRTGDVLRRDTDGFFYFVGRADDMFVCGGENVYPGEVEKLLERHEAVLQAAVVDAPDEVKGAIPIAFVVLAPGANVSPDALRRFALAHGPAFSHPRAVEIVPELPIGGTHKIDRARLLERAATVASRLAR